MSEVIVKDRDIYKWLPKYHIDNPKQQHLFPYFRLDFEGGTFISIDVQFRRKVPPTPNFLEIAEQVNSQTEDFEERKVLFDELVDKWDKEHEHIRPIVHHSEVKGFGPTSNSYTGKLGMVEEDYIKHLLKRATKVSVLGVSESDDFDGWLSAVQMSENEALEYMDVPEVEIVLKRG
jgi:hypothetical protein